MAEREKRAKRYPTDLTDAEWEIIRKRGRKPTTDLREVLNALRYLARSGAGWRMLPKDFPPWQTVYWWFRRFVRRLLVRTIHDVALMLDRKREACEQSPSAAVVDSPSVKAPSASSGGGYDAGKRIKGRKRHIAIDTDGRLLMVKLTPADISDSAGAQRTSSSPDVTPVFHPAATRDRPLLSRMSACEATGGFKPARCFSSSAANAAGVA